jgi:hypothetical protein
MAIHLCADMPDVVAQKTAGAQGGTEDPKTGVSPQSNLCRDKDATQMHRMLRRNGANYGYGRFVICERPFHSRARISGADTEMK